MIAVKARFDGKVIVPDEPLHLPQGQPLVVHVELAPTGGASALQWLADHAAEDDALPPDLGHQHDHFLYGTPKKVEPAS